MLPSDGGCIEGAFIPQHWKGEHVDNVLAQIWGTLNALHAEHTRLVAAIKQSHDGDPTMEKRLPCTKSCPACRITESLRGILLAEKLQEGAFHAGTDH